MNGYCHFGAKGFAWSFGGLLGFFWAPFGRPLGFFWAYFGLILGLFWASFGRLLGSVFGLILGLFWAPFLGALSPFFGAKRTTLLRVVIFAFFCAACGTKGKSGSPHVSLMPDVITSINPEED